MHNRGGAASPPLTHGEIRVLRYLPTNLSAREIAGAHSRIEAVEKTRGLGLLSRRPPLRWGSR